jgi:hypothetical protein
MSGDDWKKVGRGFAAVLTGGLSEVVIGGMNAADAIGSAGDAIDQLGGAIGAISATITKTGDSLTKLMDDTDRSLIYNRETGQPGELTQTLDTVEETIEDFDDLLSIERLTPRPDSDLWPSEKARADALVPELASAQLAVANFKAQRDQVVVELKTLAAGGCACFLPGLGDAAIRVILGLSFETINEVNICESFFRWCSNVNQNTVRTKCNSLRQIIPQLISWRNYVEALGAEYHRIYYNEPGLIPITLYNVNEVIERFNTIEQPKIEDILDSVDRTMDETAEVMEQVKKLFVVKRLVPVPIPDLPQAKKAHLEWLERRDTAIMDKLTKNYALSAQVSDVIIKMPAPQFTGGMKG